MVTFRLSYSHWHTAPEHNYEEGPAFCVSTGEAGHSFTILVLMNRTYLRDLQEEIALQQETRLPNPDLLQAAVLRFAVGQITQGLKDGRFLEPLTSNNTLTLPVVAADLPTIRQLLEEKTCTYQIHQGRDLFCSVATADDPTRRGQIGLQIMAPTSRVLCRICKLPDTDYVCSHLMHPEVVGKAHRGILQFRELHHALCDLEKPDIRNPAACRAGGNACWERLVAQEPDRAVLSLSPLTLPEAFDYLDVCWRLAFGKKQSLVRLNNATGVAMLSLPCATRDELIARLSALVDVLNSLHIPNERLPAPSKVQPGTLNCLQACLKEWLDEAEYLGCERAITVLRAVNDLRVSFQHSATVRDLPTVCAQLSLSWPLPAPSETWARVRVTVTEALGVIREAIRRYAESETIAPEV
jgi:hypothetical protein